MSPNKCGSNSHGFIDYEHNYTKSKDIYRIVIIGDSVAQGQGVNVFKESFGKILEKRLNNHFDIKQNNKRFEVIILALSGYSTSQELILLEEKALRYDPDLIIWSYVLNDPSHPVFHNSNGELGSYFFKPKIHFLHYLTKKIFYLKETKKYFFCSMKNKNYFITLLHCAYWDNFKRDIKKIGETSSKEDIPILFIIHPLLEKGGFKNYPYETLHYNIFNQTQKNGLITYDLLEEYKKYNVNELMQDKTDSLHPNAKGHKIVADYLFKKIINLSII